jgi:hypothetical protein
MPLVPDSRTVGPGHIDHPARYAAVVATFWRYVKIQLMVFIFGIVGPIFLVLFFTTQPDPSMKWAYWAGLLITAADVLIALALTNASDPDKTPADVRLSMAVAKRMQSRRGYTSDQTSSSSTHDPFLSSDSGSSSSDSGSSSSSD